MKFILKKLIAVFFIIAGINHFLMPDFYTKIVPDYLPLKLFLVYASGVAEVMLGLLAFSERYKTISKWGLILLLIAIFPANIFMAMNPEMFPQFSELALLIRLPLQALLVFLVWIALR